MNKLIKLSKLFAIFALIGFLTSCSKDVSEVNVIPADASMVMVIDANSLNSKSGIDDISSTNFYKKLAAEMDDNQIDKFNDYKSLIGEFDKNGIDSKSKIYFFMESMSADPVFGMTIKLADKDKFKSMLEEKLTAEKIDYAIVNKKNIEFLKITNEDDFIIAWNESSILFYINSLNNYDSNVEYATQLINQDDKESIASNDNFTDFIKETKDISVWMDYGKMMKMMPPQQMLLLYSQIPFEFDNTFMHAHLNFEKGKAVGTYTVIPNKQMKAMIEKYDLLDNKFNEDILKFIPDNNMINLSFAFNMEAYYGFILEFFGENQEKFIETFKTQFQNQTNMTFDEFIEGLGGSIYAGIYDFNYVEVESVDWNAYMDKAKGSQNIDDYKIMKKEPIPVFAIATDVNDAKIFDLIEKFGASQFTKIEDFYAVDFSEEMQVFIDWNDEILLITNDRDLISKFSKGEECEKALAKSDIGKSIQNHNVYMSVNPNFSTYPEKIKEMIRVNMDGSLVLENLTSAYKKLEIKSEGEYKQSFILYLNDDSKNSLEVIIKSLDENVNEISEL